MGKENWQFKRSSVACSGHTILDATRIECVYIQAAVSLVGVFVSTCICILYVDNYIRTYKHKGCHACVHSLRQVGAFSFDEGMDLFEELTKGNWQLFFSFPDPAKRSTPD